MKRCICWWVFWVLVTSEVTRHLRDISGNWTLQESKNQIIGITQDHPGFIKVWPDSGLCPDCRLGRIARIMDSSRCWPDFVTAS